MVDGPPDEHFGKLRSGTWHCHADSIKNHCPAGEGFVLAAAAVTRKSFGSIKIVNDVTLSLIAAGIGLVCAGELIGVREGTVLSAVLVGLFAKLIVKFVDRLGVFVQAGAAAIQEPQPPQPHESAITAIQTSEENNDQLTDERSSAQNRQ